VSSYKKPCIQCGAMVEGTAHFCPGCGSNHPFNYRCPTCKKEITKDMARCSDCGRLTQVACPACGTPTFVGKDNCESCGATLMVRCLNPKCGENEFFENAKCSACGKSMQPKSRRIGWKRS